MESEKGTVDQMSNYGLSDDYDYLRTCDVCGDRYVRAPETTCYVCQNQRTIDDDYKKPTYPCAKCKNYGAPFDGGLCYACYRQKKGGHK